MEPCSAVCPSFYILSFTSFTINYDIEVKVNSLQDRNKIRQGWMDATMNKNTFGISVCFYNSKSV